MALKRVEWFVFVGGPIRAMTDRAERAGDDDSLHSVLQRCTQKVSSAEHVVDEDLLLTARYGRDLRCTVINGSCALGRSGERGWIAQVSEHPLNVQTIDGRVVAVRPQQNAYGGAVRKQAPQ